MLRLEKRVPAHCSPLRRAALTGAGGGKASGGKTVLSNFTRNKKVLFDLRTGSSVIEANRAGATALQPTASTAAIGNGAPMCSAPTGLGGRGARAGKRAPHRRRGPPGWQGSLRAASRRHSPPRLAGQVAGRAPPRRGGTGRARGCPGRTAGAGSPPRSAPHAGLRRGGRARRAGRAPWARCCGGTSCGPAARRWTGARTTTPSCPPSPSSTTRCVAAAARRGGSGGRLGAGAGRGVASRRGGPAGRSAGRGDRRRPCSVAALVGERRVGDCAVAGTAGGWSRWSPGGSSCLPGPSHTGFSWDCRVPFSRCLLLPSPVNWCA